MGRMPSSARLSTLQHISAPSPASRRPSRLRPLARTQPVTRIQPALRPAPSGPIVKWAGGKGKLLGTLMASMPARFGRYFEPFLGGGALFFRVSPERAVLADRNDDLMNLYRCVAWKVDAVIQRLEAHRAEHSEDHYYAVRDRWNAEPRAQSAVERAAAFLYLNKTCYNGLFRVNQKGHFNVPMGRYTEPRICDREQLRAASQVLRGAELNTGNFADQVADARAGDFVYFDPPYDPVSRTASFTSYTASSFGPDEQRELATVVRDLTRRGVHVMVSSSDTPFIRRLYRGLDIAQVAVARAINSRASARGAVNELIITNGYL
jgi:DNA adenine methylase